MLNKETEQNQKMEATLRPLLDDAKYNFQLVKVGNIVHNVEYSDELLLKAYNNLSEVIRAIKPDATITDFSLYGSGTIPNECNNCHYGIEEAKVRVFDVDFLHKPHVNKAGLFCFDCHSNKKQHGELIIDKTRCSGCHHSMEEVPCEKCHSTQSDLYAGTLFSDSDAADVMFDEEVSCRDCHQNDDGDITRDVVENCINCHDEEYESTLEEWQTTISTLLHEIETLRKTSAYEINLEDIDWSNYLSVIRDGSKGAHNYELVVKELTDLKTKLQTGP